MQAFTRTCRTTAARKSLVTLGARLNIHLAFEDQALYPSLLGDLPRECWVPVNQADRITSPGCG